MGKKSRRNKAPRARRDKEEPAREWDLKWAEPPEPVVMGRFPRPPQDDKTNQLLSELALVSFDSACVASAAGITPPFDGKLKQDEKDKLTEYSYLVVFQAHKQLGFEDALGLVKRWPVFRPYWRRLRRRVCEYCGKRNELSEPRLWVCGGCGVARYCGEKCQANDFSYHAQCCPVLAHRWEGVGPIPTQLVPLLLSETWNDPAVLPSLQARRRIGESCATPEKFDRLMKGSFTPVRDGWTRAWTDVVSDAGRPDLGKHF